MHEDLAAELMQFSDDPYGFVLFAFPWGEVGGELEFAWIEDWQKEWLQEVGAKIRAGETIGNALAPILMARTSGHGIGKSALVAWIILWAMATMPDTIGVVTANTENQLKTKTWVQVAYWYRLFIGKHFFKLTATALFSADPEHDRTWRFDMVPWSERNTEAFAGLHNQGKRVVLIFDEASAIPDTIWEVAEGALTDKDTQILWGVFGNPTKNSGRFRECFAGGQFAHRWSASAIDSRTVTLTNKEQIKRWIDDYGDDSDFVRVRVKGEFPRVDATSFIPLELARSAVNRTIEPQFDLPLILGVDVGRFGDDPSVIYARRGRDGSSIPPEILPGLSTMEVAAHVAAAFNLHRAAVVMVDTGGVGGGVYDRLQQLRIPCLPVDFGSSPSGSNEVEKGVRYANKRAEIWGAVRDWLPYGSIVDSTLGMSLVEELTGPSYGLNKKEAILLEAKADMRRRNVRSPNIADALACTFAYPTFVARPNPYPLAPQIGGEYNPFSEERMAS